METAPAISDFRRIHNSLALHAAGWGSLIVGIAFLVQHIYAPGVLKEAWYSAYYFWLLSFLVVFGAVILILQRVLSSSIKGQNVIFYVWALVLQLFAVALSLLQLFQDSDLTSLTAVCIVVAILLSTRPRWYFLIMGATFCLFTWGYLIIAPRGFRVDVLLTGLFATGLGCAVGLYIERYRLKNLHLSEQLAQANAELIEQSLRDSLTGAYNRRFLNAYLAHEVSYAHRYLMPLCLIMVDIDYFKNINDTHGHPIGDIALKETVKCFQLNLRQTDIIARFGGEEFAVALPATSLANGLQVAEKLRVALSQHLIPELQWTLTASLGVVVLNTGENPEGLIQRADQALYNAKNAGRNRVASS